MVRRCERDFQKVNRALILGSVRLKFTRRSSLAETPHTGGLSLPTAIAVAVLFITGCASAPPIDQVELMPAPDVYSDGMLNPLPKTNPIVDAPYQGILYATDRKPASAADPEKYYLNDRGQILRVGVAKIALGEEDFLWEKVRKISILKTRTDKYPVKVTNAEEWGIISSSTVPNWLDLSAERSSAC